MRKKCVAIVCVVLLLGLSGCAKEKCDFCGKEKRCKQYENYFFGEMTLCNDCVDDMQSMYE